VAVAVALWCLHAGAFAHQAYYASTAELRITAIKCIRAHILESRPIVCESVLPSELSQALRYADRIDASFTRILDFNSETVLPVNPESHVPLALGGTDAVVGSFASPNGGLLASVGVFVGNYGGLADGTATLEVCSADACTRVSRQVRESIDNDFLVFDFAEPLRTAKDERFTFDFSISGGSHPLAVWLYQSVDGSVEISGVRRGSTEAPLPGQTIRLSLHHLASQDGPGAP
jgi:hypothetical protein